MIDLTNTPKDATHRSSDGGIYRIKGLAEAKVWTGDKWMDSLRDFAWLIDNLTRIEWPVKLVDGKAYQFEHLGLKTGIYSERENEFICLSCTVLIEYAKDIIKLVPEVK